MHMKCVILNPLIPIVFFICFVQNGVLLAQYNIDTLSYHTSFSIDDMSLENLTSDKFYNCESESSDNLIYFIDNDSAYKIMIPDNWEVYEDIIDSVDGAIFSNPQHPIEDLDIIVITEIKNNSMDIESYFKQELFNLITKGKDEFDLNSFGEANISEKNIYWIHSRKKSDSLSSGDYTYYFMNQSNKNIYYVQSVVHGDINTDQRHCNLRKLIETFEFID